MWDPMSAGVRVHPRNNFGATPVADVTIHTKHFRITTNWGASTPMCLVIRPTWAHKDLLSLWLSTKNKTLHWMQKEKKKSVMCVAAFLHSMWSWCHLVSSANVSAASIAMQQVDKQPFFFNLLRSAMLHSERVSMQHIEAASTVVHSTTANEDYVPKSHTNHDNKQETNKTKLIRWVRNFASSRQGFL